ncbi:MAG: hypothetical protein O9340_13855, partial [Cyclobacteriaceae bacterium]|nr:hypothetical protein [Cyclobacteriaceae bacterium]
MIPHNKPKEIKKHVKIFIVSSILGLVLLFVHSFLNDRIYPEVGFDQQISGKILNVIPYQSIVKIELVDGRRFRFNSARNYQYDPYQMNEFLKKED